MLYLFIVRYEMESLIEHQNALIENLVYEFSRGLEDEIDWNMKLSAIRGSRGVGKTTILLNFIKKNIKDRTKILYASLDDIYFAENKLIYLAKQFYKKRRKAFIVG